jgi:hypothetical protein
MRFGAVARCCRLTGSPTADILLVRNGFQMGWIYTEPISAAVVDEQAVGDGAVGQFVGIPMGIYLAT